MTEYEKPNLTALRKLAEKPGQLTECELAAFCEEVELILQRIELQAAMTKGKRK